MPRRRKSAPKKGTIHGPFKPVFTPIGPVLPVPPQQQAQAPVRIWKAPEGNDFNIVARAIAAMGTSIPAKGQMAKVSGREIFLVGNPFAQRVLLRNSCTIVEIGAHITKAWHAINGAPGRRQREISTARLAQALRTPPEPKSSTTLFKKLFVEFVTGVS